MNILTAARKSPLSQAQFAEIQRLLAVFHPHVSLESRFVETTGDLDQKTSLRSLEKTDFFTKEIDRFLLNRTCRIGIHSAKDLPDPLPIGLCIVCLTKGLDPADSLVLRQGVRLESLPSKAKIATSSQRREEAVTVLRSDLVFVDLRGTIEQRLALLGRGEADGVIVAEAALIRLGLTHLNRIKIPGITVPGQGQLAVTARQDDQEMQELFKCLDVR